MQEKTEKKKSVILRKNPFIYNTRKPQGFFGNLTLNRMNRHHRPLVDWALNAYTFNGDEIALDVGCGGGRTIAKLLRLSNNRIYGVDYSDLCIRKSAFHNKRAVKRGKLFLSRASVTDLPFSDGLFDLATAVETVYFWDDIDASFQQVRRVLKNGGTFLLANECVQNDGHTLNFDQVTANVDISIYSVKELRTLLQNNGFSIKKCDYDKSRGWLRIIAVKN